VKTAIVVPFPELFYLPIQPMRKFLQVGPPPSVSVALATQPSSLTTGLNFTASPESETLSLGQSELVTYKLNASQATLQNSYDIEEKGKNGQILEKSCRRGEKLTL